MAGALLFVFYCVEAGVFFALVPWTGFWQANNFLHATPLLSFLAENYFFRGLVSGFGVAHLVVGVHELASLFRRGRRAE
ncbi:MAG TPA: hypothetical protein VFV54_00945 [Thermoanaerobaculia bacterium]|nr:hypothetical protein [Thermoanaerobaculia bacterium]